MQVNINYANSSNYTVGRSKSIQYIVVHYTANNGDTAEGNGKYFAGPNRNASAHYFVDEDSILLSVREKDTAWHCGAKSYTHPLCRNDNSLGIEMCSKKDANGTYYIPNQTQKNTQELIKGLIKKYNIAIKNVLRHHDVTGKDCPEPFVRQMEQWNAFKMELEGGITLTTEEAIRILMEKGVINTEQYWKNASDCVLYLPELLVNMAQNVK